MDYKISQDVEKSLCADCQKIVEDNCEPMDTGDNEGASDKMDKNEPDEMNMSDEEKNKTKSFEDAHDKGLALIIGMGKPKKKVIEE